MENVMRPLYSSVLYISCYNNQYIFNWRIFGEKIHLVYNDFNFPLKIKEDDFLQIVTSINRADQIKEWIDTFPERII